MEKILVLRKSKITEIFGEGSHNKDKLYTDIHINKLNQTRKSQNSQLIMEKRKLFTQNSSRLTSILDENIKENIKNDIQSLSLVIIIHIIL